MAKKKIAIIGHSGAGKSTCLKLLGGNPSVAEMDKRFGVAAPPPMREAMRWIVDDTAGQDVIVVSVHFATLDEIRHEKHNAEYQDSFSKAFFVYLYNGSRVDRECHLRSLTAENRHRSYENIVGALDEVSYAQLDDIFRQIADQIIDTSNKTMHQVASEIDALRSSLIE